jgi:hypothetical protein
VAEQALSVKGALGARSSKVWPAVTKILSCRLVERAAAKTSAQWFVDTRLDGFGDEIWLCGFLKLLPARMGATAVAEPASSKLHRR